MRTLSLAEVAEVAGGNDIVEWAKVGGAIGTLGGTIVGYMLTGTLTGAAVGGSGFGVIGAAVGAAGGLGWSIGSWINDTFIGAGGSHLNTREPGCARPA